MTSEEKKALKDAVHEYLIEAILAKGNFEQGLYDKEDYELALNTARGSIVTAQRLLAVTMTWDEATNLVETWIDETETGPDDALPFDW